MIERDEHGMPRRLLLCAPKRKLRLRWSNMLDLDDWIVELLLDSGQHIRSEIVSTDTARCLAEDFASRLEVVTVTAINVRTGEALVLIGRLILPVLADMEPDSKLRRTADLAREQLR